MNGSKILLLIAVFGMVLWNIPNTSSIFYGQHSFYNTSEILCNKCHNNIISNITEFPSVHQEYGCKGCHTRDGNESHAASIITCNSCHTNIETHSNNTISCILCHGDHAKNKDPLVHHESIKYLKCMDCHGWYHGK